MLLLLIIIQLTTIIATITAEAVALVDAVVTRHDEFTETFRGPLLGAPSL